MNRRESKKTFLIHKLNAIHRFVDSPAKAIDRLETIVMQLATFGDTELAISVLEENMQDVPNDHERFVEYGRYDLVFGNFDNQPHPTSSDIRPRRTCDKSSELPREHIHACFEIRQYEKIRRAGV
jgi:hypothetical protein